MSEKMEYFLPINLVRERDVAIRVNKNKDIVDDIPEDFEDLELTLSMTWAKGMLGVMPMFSSLEAAREYAGENTEILVFEGPVIEELEDEETDSIG